MKVGFAGAGSMAAAMARGWAGADGGPGTMVFCDLERGRAKALAAELGGSVADDLSELAGQADLDRARREAGGARRGRGRARAGRARGAALDARGRRRWRGSREAFPGVPAVRG